MKLRIAILFCLSALLTSCGQQMIHHYYEITPSYHAKENQQQENWIQDTDILSVMEQPTKEFLFTKLGNPVLIELHQDTTYLVYNFRPTLYSNDPDTNVKPNNSNRLKKWAPATQMFAFKAVDEVIVEGALYGDEASQIVSQNEIQMDTVLVKTEMTASTGLIFGMIVGLITAVIVLMVASNAD